MTNRVYRIKLALVAAVCLAVAAVLLSGSGARAWQGRRTLSAEERRGKQIYFKGEGGTGEIMAGLGGDEPDLPATSFTCVNCHGPRGEGTDEGGLRPPPITWEKLSRPATSALTRRRRIAYTEATLARAISAGLDPEGGRLHPGMPRYRMTAAQMADLIAYLRQLGLEADADPGVTDETVRIGAALPLTGPLAAIGADLKATLAASFAEINSHGGIYNRRFELVVEDSRGDPAQTVEATRRLVEQDNVFALVSSFEPGDASATNEYIRQREVPLLGPVTLSPKLAVPPNPYVFYLLPTFNDQARTLVDFVRTKAASARVRLAVVYADNEFDRDALAGARAQARLHSMEVVSEQGYAAGRFQAAQAAAELAQRKPDYLLFFGNAEELNLLARELERLKVSVPLLSSVVMLGRGAFGLSPALAARTFLSYPSVLPNQSDFAEFLSVMQKAGVGLRSPAFQTVAYAATKILFEAAKLGGRQLDRARLVASLEQLQDFRTGVVPPLTFGPNRRVGSVGSYIVGIDLAGKQYVPLSDRLVPKERP